MVHVCSSSSRVPLASVTQHRLTLLESGAEARLGPAGSAPETSPEPAAVISTDKVHVISKQARTGYNNCREAWRGKKRCRWSRVPCASAIIVQIRLLALWGTRPLAHETTGKGGGEWLLLQREPGGQTQHSLCLNRGEQVEVGLQRDRRVVGRDRWSARCRWKLQRRNSLLLYSRPTGNPLSSPDRRGNVSGARVCYQQVCFNMNAFKK